MSPLEVRNFDGGSWKYSFSWETVVTKCVEVSFLFLLLLLLLLLLLSLLLLLFLSFVS